MDSDGRNESNYRIWRSCMESYLVGEDLWDIVCGANTNPPQDTQENNTAALKEWEKKNGKAEFVLKTSISSDKLFDRIIHCKSASSIWETLNNLYNKTDKEARLRVLETELENVTQGNLTISQLFLKINNLCLEISKLDPEEPISEDRLKCIIDRGLKPEFIPFVKSIQGWPVQPSLEEYENILVSVENLAKKRETSATNIVDESDLNAENQKKVEDRGKEVMDGFAPEASQSNANMTEPHGADREKLFTPYNEVYDSFDAMGLQKYLLRGIYALGFTKPSAIQQRGIVPFCKGLDVIQQAQSRTGKTVTFCSGVLQQLDYGLVECQALVLAPTREVAQKIENIFRLLGNYLGVKVHACVGGTSVCKHQRILSSKVHVVVGTPNCVLDMLRRQSLHSNHIRMFVLHRANEILLKGFQEVCDIFHLLPPKVQVGVFSAAMSPEALEITRKFMNKPVRL